jgi:hypothetical protein
MCHVGYFLLPSPLLQPYKTQQRLAVVFSTLCAALAFNAACFGPATELFSGDFSVSFGASLCMIVVNQIFSQLYVLSAQWAAEKRSTSSAWTVSTHISVASVAGGSIFLCLVYAVRFDTAITARWFSVVLLSFVQSFLLTGPLWILFKLGVYVLLARFRMRGMTPNEQRLALAVGDKGVVTVDEGCGGDEEAAEVAGATAGASRATASSSLPAVIEMSAVVVAAEAPASHQHVSSHLPATIAATQRARQMRDGFVSFDDNDDVNQTPRISVSTSAFENPLFASNEIDHQQLDDGNVDMGDDESHSDATPASLPRPIVKPKRSSFHQRFEIVSVPPCRSTDLSLGGRKDDYGADIGTTGGAQNVESSRHTVVLNPNALFDTDAADAAELRAEALAAAAEVNESRDARDAILLETSAGIESFADALAPDAHRHHAQSLSMHDNALFDIAAASGVIDNSESHDTHLQSNSLYNAALETQTTGASLGGTVDSVDFTFLS